MNHYFYVYKYSGDAPRIRHATLAEARAESERLARLHPGEHFEILMAVGFTSVGKPETSWMDGWGNVPVFRNHQKRR